MPHMIRVKKNTVMDTRVTNIAVRCDMFLAYIRPFTHLHIVFDNDGNTADNDGDE